MDFSLSAHGDLIALTSHAGQLASGLGRALMDRGFDVAGRETRGDFRSLPFDEQIATVGQDLKDHFWHADARVICNSFGAYLFLHGQTLMPSFPGRVLLLSPILGEFTNAQARTSFSPPRPTRLKAWLRPASSRFRVNAKCMSGKTIGKVFPPMCWRWDGSPGCR